METRKINVYHPTVPHAGQRQVIGSKARYKTLRCGRKWRKTSLIISELMMGAGTSPLAYPYIAPNRVQAKNIVWDDHIQRILTHFKEVGVPFKTNEQELSVEILGAGKVQLYGVENKEALRGISNWGGVGLDEYDDWEEDIYPTIIRPNLLVHKAWAYFAGTPKGFRNLYNLEQIVDSDWEHFHFTSHDNPDIDPKELSDLEAEYKKLGDDYYKQEILAEFVAYVGAVYKEWIMDQRFLPVPYDPNLPLYVSFDWGVNDPTAILWIQSNGREFRIIDHTEITDSNVDTIVALLKSKPYKAPTMYTGDPAGKARTLQTGTSIIEMLAQKEIFVTTKDGITIPEQIRVTKQYLPSLYVDSRLTRVRDCFVNYRYPTKKTTVINQSNEIPIHDQYSHTMRALEYFFVNYTPPTDTAFYRNDFTRWKI